MSSTGGSGYRASPRSSAAGRDCGRGSVSGTRNPGRNSSRWTSTISSSSRTAGFWHCSRCAPRGARAASRSTPSTDTSPPSGTTSAFAWTAFRARGGRRRSARLGLRADRLGGELGGLGRALADPDALGLEGLLLRLRRPGGAGDDRPGVPHLLAGRGGEAGDVGDDGLGDILGDEFGGALLGVAADLADHDDQLGLVVVLEQPEDVDEVRAHDRVAAAADDRLVA